MKNDWDRIKKQLDANLMKSMTTPVYCRFCGQEIENWSVDSELQSGQNKLYDWEKKNRTHYQCAMEYQKQMARKPFPDSGR